MIRNARARMKPMIPRYDAPMSSIAQHYGLSGLLDAILGALRAQGKDLEHLTSGDLAAVDEFHLRGREATVELAELAAVQPGWRVLDVGSGLGGSARFLAGERKCRTVGVDLTPEYCETATALSKLVGLDQSTEFRCASAVEMPFEDGAFDLAWTQHVQMNIADKAGLYREIGRVLRPGGRLVEMPFEDGAFDLAWTQHVQMNIADKAGLYREIGRVLRPGGRLAFHDILAGPGGPPHFPVPWANEPEMSFLIEPDALRALLVESGFRALTWRDTTKISREWYLAGVEQRRGTQPPPLGLHLLMGETVKAKWANVGKNLTEERITVFQAVLEKV